MYFSAVESWIYLIRFIHRYLMGFNIIINGIFVKLYFLFAASIGIKLIIWYFDL